jgi:TonB family protein
MSDHQIPQEPTRSGRLLPGAGQPQEPEQKRLMQAALVLLVTCLAIVLYRDRNFWFPDAGQDVAQEALEGSSATSAHKAAIEGKQDLSGTKKVVTRRKLPGHQEDPTATTVQNANSVPPATVTRTVLPPLEVEVVAGGTHRTLRPGSNSLRVDLETDRGSDPKQTLPPQTEIPASITTNAAERSAISPEPSDVVAQTVQPGYPLLARQMKVQGSVILQALVGRDGLIQNIHVVSGPPILASAAQEAVKQWHFKPHYEGSEAVETQAKITVNFVISTN